MRRRSQVLTGYIPMGAMRTVPSPETKPRPVETPEERRQREWRESCEQETRRVEAARAANLEAERKARLLKQAEENRKRAAEENKRREIEFENAEFQIAAIFEQYGLTESERTSVDETLIRLKLWATPMQAIERASYEAMKVIAERK
jgi:hypothetical protein